MIVKIKLASQYAKLVDKDELEMTLPDGTTLSGLCASIGRLYPALASDVEEATFIVNSDSHAHQDTVLSDGDQMYMIVPIAGG